MSLNNILTFEDYKKMNIRQVESVIYRQFMEDNIKSDVNEGIIRNAINKASGKFIQTALADEIEKGKELEKSIKEALDGLNKGFDEIEKQIDANDDDKSKSKLAQIEKVKEAIKAVQSQAFDTLTMIGSEGEIDFAGFLGSGTVAAAANFGILFSPIRSLFITRKAYKYFLGIIKQTIRRNLLIIQLNFDQFENLILQKSFETEDDSEMMTMSNTLHEIIATMQEQLCKDSIMFNSKSKQKKMSDWLKEFKTTQDAVIKQRKETDRSNPYRSLWQDQYNNTYTKTLEQIKQYVNDDSQKELDALKNSITKMAGNDVELVPYGELLISAAEEYAIHTNHGINNNFIKMSSVFNLDNQKKLIDLIVSTQKENQEEIDRNKNEQNLKDLKEKQEKLIKTGKELYEEKLKDSTETYSFDKFEEKFNEEDIKALSAFFETDEATSPPLSSIILVASPLLSVGNEPVKTNFKPLNTPSFSSLSSRLIPESSNSAIISLLFSFSKKSTRFFARISPTPSTDDSSSSLADISASNVRNFLTRSFAVFLPMPGAPSAYKNLSAVTFFDLLIDFAFSF